MCGRPSDSFPLPRTIHRHLYNNLLTSLKKGVFDKNTALEDLYVGRMRNKRNGQLGVPRRRASSGPTSQPRGYPNGDDRAIAVMLVSINSSGAAFDSRAVLSPLGQQVA